MKGSHDALFVEAGAAWSLRGREVPTRRTRGREMKLKIIPIMLLLLFSVATPVVMSMAIPREPQEFYVEAVLESVDDLLDIGGGQRFRQEGQLFDGDDEIGTIVLHVVVTNINKALRGGYARASVRFFMYFDERTDIRGTIVGKIRFDEYGVQHVEGSFIGRESLLKGTVELLEPDHLLFEGIEW